MQIFLVLETPLAVFLSKVIQHDLTKSCKKVPSIHRKLTVIRKQLLLASISAFLITSTIIVSRYGLDDVFTKGTTAEMNFLFLLPFITSLSISPVTFPFILILLEIIGTSRVLATVHPFCKASRKNDLRHDNSFAHRGHYVYHYLI